MPMFWLIFKIIITIVVLGAIVSVIEDKYGQFGMFIGALGAAYIFKDLLDDYWLTYDICKDLKYLDKDVRPDNDDHFFYDGYKDDNDR